jgi:hypothetical protein
VSQLRSTLAAVLATALVFGGCVASPTASGALGLEQPPAGLDPASPGIHAQNIAFDRTQVGVPALRPFVLILQNLDGSAPHNVSIYADAQFQRRVFEGKIVDGGRTIWYPVGALTPGQYFFQCDVHPIPSMQGTIQAL